MEDQLQYNEMETEYYSQRNESGNYGICYNELRIGKQGNDLNEKEIGRMVRVKLEMGYWNWETG